MSVAEIVNVVISRETTAVSRAGFGTLLILDPHVNWTALTRTYTSAGDMLTDGFESTDPAYIAALSAFSQNPSPTQIKIGRQQVDVAGIKVGTVVDSTVYSLSVLGVPFSFNSGASATKEIIAAGLVSLIALSSIPVTPTDDLDGTFILTADVTGVPFNVSITSVNLSIEKPLTPIGTITADLTAIQTVDSDWYALAMTSRTEANVLLAAAWIEAEIKIYISSSNDTGINNPTNITDIAYKLNAAGYDRSSAVFSNDTNKFPETAWFGKQLPTDAGSSTWMFKTLAGITVDNLSTTQSQAARAKKANTYEKIGGVNMTQEGTVASGEFIDIIRGIDWLQARMTEGVFSVLVNQPKVPMTDAGIASVESPIKAALVAGQDSGLIAIDPPFIVSVPLAANVPTTDKAIRFLSGMTFEATLQGAVHKTLIKGSVSL